MDDKKIYCFIGLPASGKGTQAQMFAEEYGLEHISIGDLIRDELKNNSSDPLTKEIEKQYSSGAPVADNHVFRLIEKKLSNVKTGVVFDNFPFTKNQAEFLNSLIKKEDWGKPVIVYININPETAVNRISKRKVCPNCKSIYNEDIEFCKKCGAKLITRSDDNEETVRKRINTYEPQIKEILNIYRNEGEVLDIDGEPSIEEVYASVKAKIKNDG